MQDAQPQSGRSAVATEIAATLTLAWPIVVTNLAQNGMMAIGVMMMGRLSAESLAAGALANTLNFALLIVGIGFMSVVAPMVAREIGRKAHSVRDVRRTVRQGFWTTVILTIPVWILFWNTESVLLALGQQPELARESARYMGALQWGFPFFLLYLVLRSFVAALQRPRVALFAVLIALGWSALANWALMFGHLGFPALGLRGSGIAVASTHVVMFSVLALFVSLDRRMRRYHVFGRFWRPDIPRLKELWRLGAPVAATLLFEAWIFQAVVFLMGRIDSVSLAAHAIAIQIASLAFMIPLGLSQAASVRVGRFFGAHDAAGVKRAGWTAFWICMAAMVATASVMVLAPETLASAFLRADTDAARATLETAISFLAMAALFQLADGAQAVGSGMLRGLHDTRVPMLYALAGYWGVGLPLGYLLAFHAGWRGMGLWTGLAVGLAVVAVLMIVRWARRTAHADNLAH